MTVPSQVYRNEYACDGSQTVFPYTFRILDATHILVLLTDPEGTETSLTLSSGYTVSGVGDNNGGNITTIETYEEGYTLVFIRDVPLTQLIDYIECDKFPAESHEKGLDSSVMLIQQLSEIISRALLFTRGSGYAGLTLPLPEGNKYLAWRTDLLGVKNVELVSEGDLTATDFGKQLIAAADALEARNIQFVAEFLTPEQEGAKGDGTTDDITALTAIANQAKTYGGAPIMLGVNKKYKITSPLTIHDGTRLLGSGDSYCGGGGSGYGSTIYNVGAGPAIIVEGKTGFGFEIAHFHILGNEGTDDGIYLKEVDAKYPRSGIIHHLSINKAGRDSIRLDCFSYLELRRLTLANGTNAINIVKDTVSTHREYLVAIGVIANTFSGNGINIIADCNNLSFYSPALAYCNKGVYINPAAGGTQPHRVYFYDLSTGQSTLYGVEIYAENMNQTELYFKNHSCFLPGVNANEKAFYVHRAGAYTIQDLFADVIVINKTGGVAPTAAIDVETGSIIPGARIKGIRNKAYAVWPGCSIAKEVEIEDAAQIGYARTFGNADATPSVWGGHQFNTGTAALTITMFDEGYIKQRITVISKGAITYDVTGTNLKAGTTDLVTAVGDMTRWEFDGTDWYLLQFMDMSDDMS